MYNDKNIINIDFIVIDWWSMINLIIDKHIKIKNDVPDIKL
jgi:uncharacterized membrane protein YwzB